MIIIVNKWGNSLGVRIPQPIANKVGFTVGMEVTIEVVDNTVVISPVKRKYQLDGRASRRRSMVAKYIPKRGDIVRLNFDPTLGREQAGSPIQK
jgi:antitoxin component of MazEF toxin-antitoxin module